MDLHIYQSMGLSQLAAVFCTGRRMGLVAEAFFHMDHVFCLAHGIRKRATWIRTTNARNY